MQRPLTEIRVNETANGAYFTRLTLIQSFALTCEEAHDAYNAYLRGEVIYTTSSLKAWVNECFKLTGAKTASELIWQLGGTPPGCRLEPTRLGWALAALKSKELANPPLWNKLPLIPDDTCPATLPVIPISPWVIVG